MAEGVGDGVGVGSSGLKTGLSGGFGAALIATPLFQTSLLPDLMQVNFFPAAVAVVPALLHLDPGLTDAKDGALTRDMHSNKATRTRERVM